MKKALICTALSISALLCDATIEVKGNPTYSIDTEPSTSKVIESGSVIEFTGEKAQF